MLRKKGKIWYVQYRDLRGKMNTCSLKVTDRDQAVKLEKAFMDSLRGQRALRQILKTFPNAAGNPIPPPEQYHRQGSIRLDAMLECAKGKRTISHTTETYWRNFIRAVPARYADEVTPQMALKYLESNFRKKAANTYNNAKSALNSIFRCCLVEGHLETSPFASIINRKIEGQKHHRNLTLEEFDRIMEAAPVDVQIMTMLSRWTAQRLETCSRITMGMFDRKRKVLIIKPGKTARFNKWVCCPLMPPLEKFLDNLHVPDPDTPIVQQFGYSPNNVAFSKKFADLLKTLKIGDTEDGTACFHSLRGTAITWFKEHGVKGEDLRAITGHASASVEDVYARDIATVSRIARGVDG